MDEILIEDKKYISSKLAAKMTGYAKDYVGQLCREGRVPARLVGRGWYVLESAIQDHRFGNPNESMSEVVEEKEIKIEPVPAKTWEFPRYESVQAEILPSINRLNEEKSAPEIPIEEEIEGNEEEMPEAPQNVHDSWRQWFDTVAEAMPEDKKEVPEAPIETMRAQEEVKEEGEEEKEIEDEQVNVPLRVVSNYFPTKEIQPNYPVAKVSIAPKEAVVTKRSNAWVRAIQAIAGIVMILSTAVAVAGSGYFDAYLITNSQTDALIGVTVYIR